MGPQSTETAIAGLTEVEGWEALWLAHKNDPEDPAERDKWHGRVHELSDEEGRFLVTVLFRTTLSSSGTARPTRCPTTRSASS